MKKPATATAPAPAVTPEDIGVKLPPPDLAAVPALKDKAKKIARYLERRNQLSALLKQYEQEKHDLDDQIHPMLFRANLKAVRVGDFTIRIMETGRTILDKTALVEHGVDPAVIKECEKYVPSKPHIRVDGPRGGGRERGEGEGE